MRQHGSGMGDASRCCELPILCEQSDLLGSAGFREPWYIRQNPRCLTASAVGVTRHPRRVAAGIPRGNSATLRERECNQRPTTRDRANTGVLRVYLRQREWNEAVRGETVCAWLLRYCGSNQGCCGVNLLKAKDRGWNRRPSALTRVASAAVAVKGQARCAARRKRAPLTPILAAAVLQL